MPTSGDGGGREWYGDTLVGGQGDEVIDPGIEHHTRVGYHVPDILACYGARAEVQVDLSGPVGHVTGGAGSDRVVDHEGMAVFGTRFDDVLTGSQYDDDLEGGRGNDTLSGGAGDDTLTTGGYAN